MIRSGVRLRFSREGRRPSTRPWGARSSILLTNRHHSGRSLIVNRIHPVASESVMNRRRALQLAAGGAALAGLSRHGVSAQSSTPMATPASGDLDALFRPLIEE